MWHGVYELYDGCACDMCKYVISCLTYVYAHVCACIIYVLYPHMSFHVYGIDGIVYDICVYRPQWSICMVSTVFRGSSWSPGTCLYIASHLIYHEPPLLKNAPCLLSVGQLLGGSWTLKRQAMVLPEHMVPGLFPWTEHWFSCPLWWVEWEIFP